MGNILVPVSKVAQSFSRTIKPPRWELEFERHIRMTCGASGDTGIMEFLADGSTEQQIYTRDDGALMDIDATEDGTSAGARDECYGQCIDVSANDGDYRVDSGDPPFTTEFATFSWRNTTKSITGYTATTSGQYAHMADDSRIPAYVNSASQWKDTIMTTLSAMNMSVLATMKFTDQTVSSMALSSVTQGSATSKTFYAFETEVHDYITIATTTSKPGIIVCICEGSATLDQSGGSLLNEG